MKLKGKRNPQLLKETKIIHQKTKDLSRIQIIEYSILFIMLNNSKVTLKKIEDISSLKFFSEKNENLKNIIISSLVAGDQKSLQTKINKDFQKHVDDIIEKTKVKILIEKKTTEETMEVLEDLIENFNEQFNLKKIESLEKELINNLDENAYSELIKLKSQINRD